MSEVAKTVMDDNVSLKKTVKDVCESMLVFIEDAGQENNRCRSSHAVNDIIKKGLFFLLALSEHWIFTDPDWFPSSVRLNKQDMKNMLESLYDNKDEDLEDAQVSVDKTIKLLHMSWNASN